jgi:predicted transcriptional regulator
MAGPPRERGAGPARGDAPASPQNQANLAHADPAASPQNQAGPAHADPAASPQNQAGPAHADPAAPKERDGAAAGRFVEDFASALVEMGVPRMPARIFSALTTSDSGRLSAAELAARLQASPAAVSGAVRYLVQLGLARREGEPGSRRHYYRVPDNVWNELITLRNRQLARWTGVMREGIDILGADTPAGARIAESVRYFEFVSTELPGVISKWQEHKADLDGGTPPDR